MIPTALPEAARELNNNVPLPTSTPWNTVHRQSAQEDLFAELFLPELVMLSECYGALGMQCCANARHQWEGFLRIPNLRVLNIAHLAEMVLPAYSFFAPHVVQMHNNVFESPAWTWPTNAPADARVIFDMNARTRVEALEISDRLWELRNNAACSVL